MGGANGRRPGRAILVVDDDGAQIRAFERILRPKGIEVVGAADQDGALGQVEAHRDVLGIALVDVRLGAEHGISVAAEIRFAAPRLPIAIMTAYPTAELAMSALDHGFLTLLPKPLPDDTLAGLVARRGVCHLP